jgi:hypothetical protein
MYFTATKGTAAPMFKYQDGMLPTMWGDMTSWKMIILCHAPPALDPYIEDANPGKINLRPTAINPEVCVSIPPLVVHRTRRLTYISSAVAAKTARRFCS